MHLSAYLKIFLPLGYFDKVRCSCIYLYRLLSDAKTPSTAQCAAGQLQQRDTFHSCQQIEMHSGNIHMVTPAKWVATNCRNAALKKYRQWCFECFLCAVLVAKFSCCFFLGTVNCCSLALNTKINQDYID